MEAVVQLELPYIILTAAILVGQAALIINDPYISREHRQVLLMITAMCACLVVQNYADSVLSFSPAEPSVIWMRTFTSVIGYSLRPVVILLFFYIIRPGRRYTWAWVLAAINAAVYATAFFSDICFTIDESNHWQGGPLSKLGFIVSLILLVYYLYLTFNTFRNTRKAEVFITVFTFVLVMTGTCMDFRDEFNRPLSFLTIAIVISSMFVVSFLHIQFEREHEEDLKAQQRLQIMTSQMQPHFLFNTIATIQALCSTDPQMAAKITGKFGKYLRQNIDSLEQDIRIPFDKEMEHTLNYVDIEVIRFPNIRVGTDIQDHDFMIPALTVQPMVENAIRHGVRVREEGVITISSRRDGKLHEVVIEDNGKGFDADSLEKMEGTHLGIRNVRERIEKICNGSLDIQSEPDAGTRVVIRIPVEEQQ